MQWCVTYNNNIPHYNSYKIRKSIEKKKENHSTDCSIHIFLGVSKKKVFCIFFLSSLIDLRPTSLIIHLRSSFSLLYIRNRSFNIISNRHFLRISRSLFLFNTSFTLFSSVPKTCSRVIKFSCFSQRQ